jgi:hypothetical protein
MIGLAIILVLSIWSLAGGGDENLMRAVISAFIFFTMLLPTAAWWRWHRHQSQGNGAAGRSGRGNPTTSPCSRTG